MGGVFVALLVGLGIACVIAFAEFIFKACSMSRRRNSLELKSVSRLHNLLVDGKQRRNELRVVEILQARSLCLFCSRTHSWVSHVDKPEVLYTEYFTAAQKCRPQ